MSVAAVIDIDEYKSARIVRERGPLQLLTFEQIVARLEPELPPLLCSHPIDCVRIELVVKTAARYRCWECLSVVTLPPRCPCGGVIRFASCGSGLGVVHCSECAHFWFQVRL